MTKEKTLHCIVEELKKIGTVGSNAAEYRRYVLPVFCRYINQENPKELAAYAEKARLFGNHFERLFACTSKGRISTYTFVQETAFIMDAVYFANQRMLVEMTGKA